MTWLFLGVALARKPSSTPEAVATVNPPCGLPVPSYQLGLPPGAELPAVAALAFGDARLVSYTTAALAEPRLKNAAVV